MRVKRVFIKFVIKFSFIFSTMKNFIGQYNLSKTLRFELKPVGKTLENIQKKELIQKDEDLAESYTKMKETIDEFHKDFIKNVLSNTTLNIENLKTFKEFTHHNNKKRLTITKKNGKKFNKRLEKRLSTNSKPNKITINSLKKNLLKNC